MWLPHIVEVAVQSTDFGCRDSRSVILIAVIVASSKWMFVVQRSNPENVEFWCRPDCFVGGYGWFVHHSDQPDSPRRMRAFFGDVCFVCSRTACLSENYFLLSL